MNPSQSYQWFLLKHSDTYYGVVNSFVGNCLLAKTRDINKAVRHNQKLIFDSKKALSLIGIEAEIVEIRVNEFGKIIRVLNQTPEQP